MKEEFFEASLNADALYHLDKNSAPENLDNATITGKTAILIVVGENKKCKSIFGLIEE